MSNRDMLRQKCKALGIKYSTMTVAQMEEAISIATRPKGVLTREQRTLAYIGQNGPGRKLTKRQARRVRKKSAKNGF